MSEYIEELAELAAKLERERIIKLLEIERLIALKWLSHDGECDCRIKGLEVERLIALIKGETK